MKTGQVVQLKPNARSGPRASIPEGATGIVICSYRLLQRFPKNPDRIDVEFKGFGVLWGEACDNFEIRETADALPAAR